MIFVRRQLLVHTKYLYSIFKFLVHREREAKVKITVGKSRFYFNGNFVMHFGQVQIANFSIQIRQIVMRLKVSWFFFETAGETIYCLRVMPVLKFKDA